MTDNIVNFPGVDGPGEKQEFSADDALTKCLGKYEDLIIIGITADKAQCVSTVLLDEAIYELSRAQHMLHRYIDALE